MVASQSLETPAIAAVLFPPFPATGLRKTFVLANVISVIFGQKLQLLAVQHFQF